MPRDEETGLVEPEIVINGVPLTFQQAMSLRVAVGGYRMLLDTRSMRENLGQLAESYAAHLIVVERLMLRINL